MIQKLAAIGIGLALLGPMGSAFAQVKLKKEDLVGTWSYVSVVAMRPDGTSVQTWGPNPVGLVIFTSNGRYSLQLIKPDLPKLGTRATGSPEENAAIVQGVFSHFGTYTVNEQEGTYTLHIEASSFASFAGTSQERKVVSISSDELRTTNSTTSIGAVNNLVYKRLR